MKTTKTDPKKLREFLKNLEDPHTRGMRDMYSLIKNLEQKDFETFKLFLKDAYECGRRDGKLKHKAE